MVRKPDSPTVKRIAPGQRGQQNLSGTRHRIDPHVIIAKQASLLPERSSKVKVGSAKLRNCGEVSPLWKGHLDKLPAKPAMLDLFMHRTAPYAEQSLKAGALRVCHQKSM